jgi:hypothetical protein
MAARIKLALVALVAAFGLMLVVTAKATADDKKCDSCVTVKKVIESMRCEKCKGQDKACDKCLKDQKALEDKFSKCCKDKECDVCKTIEAAKCHECAAKKAIIEHTFCCAKCEKAGNEKAADCKYCQDQRTALAAKFPPCPVDDKDKKEAK